MIALVTLQRICMHHLTDNNNNNTNSILGATEEDVDNVATRCQLPAIDAFDVPCVRQAANERGVAVYVANLEEMSAMFVQEENRVGSTGTESAKQASGVACVDVSLKYEYVLVTEKLMERMRRAGDFVARNGISGEEGREEFVIVPVNITTSYYDAASSSDDSDDAVASSA